MKQCFESKKNIIVKISKPKLVITRKQQLLLKLLKSNISVYTLNIMETEQKRLR